MFDFLHEELERVKTGIWEGDCFIYNTRERALRVLVGTHARTAIARLDIPRSDSSLMGSSGMSDYLS